MGRFSDVAGSAVDDDIDLTRSQIAAFLYRAVRLIP